jgi:hypothetical protein
MSAPLINSNWIFGHSALLHDRAGRAKQPGKLVLTGFGEDPSRMNPETGKLGVRLTPKVFHVDVGDHALMTERVGEIAGLAHYNVYMPLAVFRADLRPGAKGAEEDVVACLGLVADFDDQDAANWADRLPIAPHYVLETSNGRFQAFYFFKDPAPVEAVKPVAQRLKAYAKCDHGTSDISHVWRIAGTLNWPNAKKVAEGRSPEPQLVKIVQPFVGKTIAFEKLADALPESGTARARTPRSGSTKRRRRAGQPHPAAVEGTSERQEALLHLLKLPEELQEKIKQPAVDRSAALFSLVPQLIEQGLTDEAIESLLYAHPEGPGGKYGDRDDLDKEIARIRAKTSPKPVIQLRGGALSEVVDQAEQLLIERDDEVFQRGNLIIRPGLSRVKVADGREIRTTRLVPVKLHHMRERFSRVIDFQKLDRRTRSWNSVDCPKEVADTYLEREGQWKLPMLTRVISAPTLRSDGSVLDEPGYDPPTGLLFDAQGGVFPKLSLSPTHEGAAGAVSVLKELLATFPFIDDASRSVALSAILTALVRTSLPSAPLHAFAAPTAGSGKSMLVDIASMIATGRETPVLAQGSTGEEFEKRLGAALLAGDATVSIDNCEQPLGGELLCQMLTQPSVNIRLLGQSKNVEVLTNATLFATGNNLRLVGDLTRRALVSFLDPQCERPELREFPVNPLKLIRQDRGRYVVAALTVLRAYHIAGRPQQVQPLGSFESWSRWVRDALIWAGEADPCRTMERARDEDPQLERLRSVMHHWQQALGERSVSAADIVESAGFDNQNHALRDALMAVASVGHAVDTRRLGMWLSKNKDRVVDGFKIVLVGVRSGFTHWQLLQVRQAPSV